MCRVNKDSRTLCAKVKTLKNTMQIKFKIEKSIN